MTGIVNPEGGEHGLEHWWGVIVGFRVFLNLQMLRFPDRLGSSQFALGVKCES